MQVVGGTMGRKIGHTTLAVGAVFVVCLLSILAVLFTLACAPPLKRLVSQDDQAP